MRLLCLAGVALVAGCTAVPPDAPRYARFAEPPPGLGNVYIYRPYQPPLLMAPEIKVNGKPVMKLPNQAYTVLQLPEGQNSILVDWDPSHGPPDRYFEFRVTAVEPTYIQLKGTVTAEYNPTYESHVSRLLPSVAELELLDCCRYVAPPASKN